VTPWFAAASGFVIAASLWIYSPHAMLQFPNNAIGLQHCHDGCSPAAGEKGSGSLASSGKHRLPDRRKSAAGAGAHPRASSRTAAAGLTFSYIVLPSQDGTFTIRIIVTGKRAFSDWRLAFVLRGDRIGWVSGADWQRRSRDSGTASGHGGDAQQWTGEWPGGPGDGPGGSGHIDGDQQPYWFTFLVSGTGPPAGPTRCLYDGRTCSFSEASHAP
jgi:hypothetical protein